MLFLFASHLALAHIQDDATPPRAYILGGGLELPPLLRKMSEVVSKIDKSPGWKNLPDGKIAFRSAKQICFIFLPSLREIQNWQNIVFFRKKIERDGFWAKFQFGELPDHLKEKVRATLPELDFKVNSAISIGPQIITSITGLGRKVNVPANLIQPELKGLGPAALAKALTDMDPVNEKQQRPRVTESPWLPFYQIWNLNVGFDGRRSELVQEMVTLFNVEMGKRTDSEMKILMDLLKDNSQVSDYLKSVGKSAVISNNVESENKSEMAISTSLLAFRNILGFHENDDWQNFSQQAMVSSISIGFSVNLVKMVNKRRQLVSVGLY